MKRKTQKQKRKPAKLTPAILTATPAKQEAALRHIEKRIAAGDRITRAELKIYYELEKITNPESIRGVKEAAAYCGMTERILRYDLGRQRLKANPDGTFDRAEIDRWVQSRDGREKSPEDASLTAKEKKAKAHYWTFKAKKEELLYNNSRDLLVGWTEIEKEWDARLIELTSSLDNLADRASGLVVGKSRDEVRDILRTEVRMFRESYARIGKYTPEVK